jgi:hypothetical protein
MNRNTTKRTVVALSLAICLITVVIIVMARRARPAVVPIADGASSSKERDGSSTTSRRPAVDDTNPDHLVSDNRASVADAHNTLADSRASSFIFADDQPARDLAICSSTNESSSCELGITDAPVQWTDRVDGKGHVSADVLGRLGPIISIRLSDCAVHMRGSTSMPHTGSFSNTPRDSFDIGFDSCRSVGILPEASAARRADATAARAGTP